jgi:hypothetical protein
MQSRLFQQQAIDLQKSDQGSNRRNEPHRLSPSIPANRDPKPQCARHRQYRALNLVKPRVLDEYLALALSLIYYL